MAAPSLVTALDFFGDPQRVLVPGCGMGHDAAALARGGHEVEGWDLAPTAIREARKSYPMENLTFLEKDLLADAKDQPGEKKSPARFQAIFEHTFLCAIGPTKWEQAVRRFSELLKPGGKLFAILFTNLVEHEPPPWKITEQQAIDLFQTDFRILDIDRSMNSFPHRVGEETFWCLEKRAF